MKSSMSSGLKLTLSRETVKTLSVHTGIMTGKGSTAPDTIGSCMPRPYTKVCISGACYVISSLCRE